MDPGQSVRVTMTLCSQYSSHKALGTLEVQVLCSDCLPCRVLKINLLVIYMVGVERAVVRYVRYVWKQSDMPERRAPRLEIMRK